MVFHGNGQNYYSWIKQLNSNLNKKYHLASFDLRGHGNSGKPNSIHDYNKACVWAEDVRSVMLETNLTKPILVGWSFGGLIIMHYINCFGIDEISGIVLVSSRSRLVNLSTLPNPHAIESQILLREKDFKIRKRGAEIFTRLLTYQPLENKTYHILKLSSLMVPSFVREFIATPILDYNSKVIPSYSFLIPKIFLYSLSLLTLTLISYSKKHYTYSHFLPLLSLRAFRATSARSAHPAHCARPYFLTLLLLLTSCSKKKAYSYLLLLTLTRTYSHFLAHGGSRHRRG